MLVLRPVKTGCHIYEALFLLTHHSTQQSATIMGALDISIAFPHVLLCDCCVSRVAEKKGRGIIDNIGRQLETIFIVY